jgi:hypothetical protein
MEKHSNDWPKVCRCCGESINADTSANYAGKCLPCYDGDTDCPNKDDYKGWSEEKKSDRLFMSCPGCGSYGSHVEAARA